MSSLKEVLSQLGQAEIKYFDRDRAYASYSCGIVYYIKIHFQNNFYYKIGVTYNLQKRLKLMLLVSKEAADIQVLDYAVFPTYLEAFKYETAVKNKFCGKLINFQLLNSGNSEVYTSNILNLSEAPAKHCENINAYFRTNLKSAQFNLTKVCASDREAKEYIVSILTQQGWKIKEKVLQQKQNGRKTFIDIIATKQGEILVLEVNRGSVYASSLAKFENYLQATYKCVFVYREGRLIFVQ